MGQILSIFKSLPPLVMFTYQASHLLRMFATVIIPTPWLRKRSLLISIRSRHSSFSFQARGPRFSCWVDMQMLSAVTTRLNKLMLSLWTDLRDTNQEMRLRFALRLKLTCQRWTWKINGIVLLLQLRVNTVQESRLAEDAWFKMSPFNTMKTMELLMFALTASVWLCNAVFKHGHSLQQKLMELGNVLYGIAG